RRTDGRDDTDYVDVEFVTDARRFEPSIPNLPSIAGMGASLRLLLELGPDEVERRAVDLAAAAAEAVSRLAYRVVSSRIPGERSRVISSERDGVDPDHLEAVLREAGVVAAARGGRLRLSLHGYNDESDVERLLAALPR